MPLAKKLLCGALAIATVVSAGAVSNPAEARRGRNAAIAAGVVGGLALGAAAAAAANQNRGYYYGSPGYYSPGYYSPGYYAESYGPDCYWQRQRIWVEGWGWQVRRVRICE